MLTNDDLKAIKKIIKNEVSPLKKGLGNTRNEVNSVKKQLDTVEMKVELVNKRVEKAQVDIVSTLSELTTSGYELHEERIKKIEDQLKTLRVQ